MIIRTLFAFASIILALGSSHASQELPFPGLGMLYVPGLECREKNEFIETVPNHTIQYYLSRSRFFRLIVTSNDLEIEELSYPDAYYLDLLNELPEEANGYGFALAIHSETLETAKIGMERFNIKSGQIAKKHDIYYWTK